MAADKSGKELDVNFHFAPHAIPRIFGNLHRKPEMVETPKPAENEWFWNWLIRIMMGVLVVCWVILPVLLFLWGCWIAFREVAWLFRDIWNAVANWF